MSLSDAQERNKSTGRNDVCPCGSGKKYKKCHRVEDEATISAELKRLVDVAEAERLAAEEAEEKESDASGGKKTETKSGGSRLKQKSRSKSSGDQGAAAKGSSAQSLPRRGAV